MCILLTGPQLNGNKRIGQLIRSPSTDTVSLLDSECCRVHEENIFTTGKNSLSCHGCGINLYGVFVLNLIDGAASVKELRT